MNFEQEIASIIAYTLEKAGNPAPYYYNVPEEFTYPAMYFPQPEINTRGETFNTYAMEYVWYINVFCKTSEAAHEIALTVLSAIKGARNLIPLIDTDGELTGKKLRLDDPSIKIIDSGVAQISLSWTSRRPYDSEDVTKMMTWEIEGWNHPDIYNSVSVDTAFSNAINHYLMDYPRRDYSASD